MGELFRWTRLCAIATAAAMVVHLVGIRATVAQTQGASAVVKLDDVTEFTRVDQQLAVLQDCSQTLTFEQVQSQAARGLFRRAGRVGPSYGYSPCAYWLMLTLQWNGESHHDWILTLENPRVTKADLYEPTLRQPRVMHSGAELSIADRAIPSRYPAFPLGAGAAQTRTVYLRVQTNDVATFPVAVATSTVFWQRIQHGQVAFGLYFGLFVFATLLNCFAYLHLRDPTYLTYVSTTVSYALYQAALNGIDVEFLGHYRLNHNGADISLFCGLSIASYALLSWRFLGLADRAPRLRLLLYLLVAGGGCVALIALLGQARMAAIASNLVAPITVVGLAVMTAVAVYHGCPQAGYFIAGGLLQLAGVLLDGLRNFGILPTNFLTEFGDQIGSTMFICILSLALTARFDTIQRDQVAARRVAAEFLRKNAEAKLQALQARINPHFLFNTLTTIAGLVREAPERAEGIVLKLAKLFRYTLAATDDEGRVQLSEELSIVRAYLEIEQARFGCRLAFSISTEGDAESVYLPGLLLQPLVENCVKHGLRPKPQGGHVNVTARVADGRCRVTVEDDGVGMDVNRAPLGHGLASVRERLQLAFGGAAQMTLSNGTGLRVVLDIPVRNTP